MGVLPYSSSGQDFVFHPAFAAPTSPTSVILQSTTGTCFHFDLSLLGHLSSFFADLRTLPCPQATSIAPAHSTCVAYDVIPLPHASTTALWFSLQAIRATLAGGTPSDLPHHPSEDIDSEASPSVGRWRTDGAPRGSAPDASRYDQYTECLTLIDAYDLPLVGAALLAATKRAAFGPLAQSVNIRARGVNALDVFAMARVLRSEQDVSDLSGAGMLLPFPNMGPSPWAIELLAAADTRGLAALLALHGRWEAALARFRNAGQRTGKLIAFGCDTQHCASWRRYAGDYAACVNEAVERIIATLEADPRTIRRPVQELANLDREPCVGCRYRLGVHLSRIKTSAIKVKDWTIQLNDM